MPSPEEEDAQNSAATASIGGDASAAAESPAPNISDGEVTKYRAGWSRPPKISKSVQMFVPSTGDLGESAAQKILRENRAAIQREKEEEAERLAENKRLDTEILEKRMAVEKLEQERIEQEKQLTEQRMAAATDASPSIVDENLEKVEEGATSTEEGLDQHDEEVADRSRRKRRFMFFLLLILAATAIALGVIFGRKSEDSVSDSNGGSGGSGSFTGISGGSGESATSGISGSGDSSVTIGDATVAMIAGAADNIGNETTSLAIDATDTSLINGGGAPNSRYPFILEAEGLPSGIDEVRFEWTPGFGAGSSIITEVEGELATNAIEVTYPEPGMYNITASVYDGEVELATDSFQVQISGTTLKINPPGLTDAQLLVPHTFNFNSDDIPASVTHVKFTWSFGVGESGAGNSGHIEVSSGQASMSASQSYTSNGAYGLVVDVRDAITSSVLAQDSVTVFVGPRKERNNTLDSCNEWSASQAGGEGVTIDNWDISKFPADTVFDVRYEAYSVPDKFLVNYPVSNGVLDSGWRGSSSYSGSQLYPGGVSGAGGNTIYNVFSRLTPATFRVTVIGPDPGTEWYVCFVFIQFACIVESPL